MSSFHCMAFSPSGSRLSVSSSSGFVVFDLLPEAGLTVVPLFPQKPAYSAEALLSLPRVEPSAQDAAEQSVQLIEPFYCTNLCFLTRESSPNILRVYDDLAGLGSEIARMRFSADYPILRICASRDRLFVAFRSYVASYAIVDLALRYLEHESSPTREQPDARAQLTVASAAPVAAYLGREVGHVRLVRWTPAPSSLSASRSSSSFSSQSASTISLVHSVHSSEVTALRLSADGSLLVTADQYGTKLKLWRVDGLQLGLLAVFGQVFLAGVVKTAWAVTDVAFSANNALLCVVGMRQRLQLFDLDAGRRQYGNGWFATANLMPYLSVDLSEKMRDGEAKVCSFDERDPTRLHVAGASGVYLAYKLELPERLRRAAGEAWDAPLDEKEAPPTCTVELARSLL